MTNHEGHIKLWDELARTGGNWKVKYNIFRKMFPEIRNSTCFACLQCAWDCEKCPIDWGQNNGRGLTCWDDGAPYQQWGDEKSKEKRQRLAAIIRDLPWRDK